MNAMLGIKVNVRPLPLSSASVHAIRNLASYDYIAFTSKNARKFFTQALREYRIKPPARGQIMQVGQRADLLKFPLRGKRILFPRSAIALFDIVRRLRTRGAIVRVVQLYTAHGAPLSQAQKRLLLAGEVKKLYFKSPSGIDGLLRQVSRSNRKSILAIPALCIGETTAQAARLAGFKQVSIKNV